MEYDGERTEFLKRKHVRVLRFENRQVFESLEFVLAEIQRNLITTPASPKIGGGVSGTPKSPLLF
jgi:very-short-patch-repair endonuclease